MEPNRDCPRFDRCRVNNCPLTAKYPDWYVSPGDAERKCTLGKVRRLLIAAKYPGVLKFEGLLQREFSWSQRPESKKVTRSMESLKESLNAYRGGDS